MDNGLTQNQPSVDAAQTSTPNYAPQQGRVITQDEVNYITSKVRAEAYEQGMREAHTKQAPAPAQPQVSMDEIIEKAKASLRQEIKQEQDNTYVANLANAYHQTVAQGVLEYGPEYKTTVESINWGELPALLPLVQSQPNVKEVMLELAKKENISRFSNITNLLGNRQWKKAQEAMEEFSSSVSSNKKAADSAKSQPTAPEPLSAIKPSSASAGSGKPTTYAEISAAIDAKRFRK